MKEKEKKRYKQLFPFYRLGILLFLSLFFTAFSLSLFIAPDTAAPKNNTESDNEEKKRKNHFRLTLCWKSKKKRKDKVIFLHIEIYSHRPKIILQKSREFICLCMSIEGTHNTTEKPDTKLLDVSIIKIN